MTALERCYSGKQYEFCDQQKRQSFSYEYYALCYAENFITVMTPAVYDYQYLPEVAVSKKSHVTFRVRAGGDAHVALSTMYGDTDRKTYELVLGASNNSRSVVRYYHADVINAKEKFLKRYILLTAVSYTHLTLPTNREV